MSVCKGLVAAIPCVMIAAGGCNRDGVIGASSDRRADELLAQVVSPPWPTEKLAIQDDPADKPLVLDDVARGILARQALAGDEGSALKLFRYYSRQSPADIVARNHWLTIAAENGNIFAMGALASIQEESGGEENCLRAKYWSERALRTNVAANQEAQTQLANLMGLAENWQQCLNRGESKR